MHSSIHESGTGDERVRADIRDFGKRQLSPSPVHGRGRGEGRCLEPRCPVPGSLIPKTLLAPIQARADSLLSPPAPLPQAGEGRKFGTARLPFTGEGGVAV